jgi:hypothetical protein
LGSGAAAGAGSTEFVGSPAGSHVSTAPVFYMRASSFTPPSALL